VKTVFLSTVKSKGNFYVYLCCYAAKQNYSRTSITVYRFGRKEAAISNMRNWKVHFEEFPEELVVLGCGKKDLEEWISYLETGISKTRKQLKSII
jgi:hypothetical protein